MSTLKVDTITDEAGTGAPTLSQGLTVNGGTIKLDGNYPVGSDNVALGDTALDSLTSGNFNTAFGAKALKANTEGSFNVAAGRLTLTSNTTGQHNAAIGSDALQGNTTGNYNTALGNGALAYNTTASNNTAVGFLAGYSNVAAGAQVFVGYKAGYATTTGGGSSTFVGYEAGLSNTTGGNNTALGRGSFLDNTTGSNSVALGYDALANNTTASYNTAVGYLAGYSNTTGSANVFVGENAGYFNTNQHNTFLGAGAGYFVTSGQKNTVLGRYNGNQGGLDIRTSSNNIVLSDGDGNSRLHNTLYGSNYTWWAGNGTSGSYWPARVSVSGQDAVSLNTTLGTLGVTTDNGGATVYLNRTNSDGKMIGFYHQDVEEGSISVSGTSVSYNGGHLARWSQFADNSKDTSLLKGTVMTNLDQMAVWSHDAVAVGDEFKNAMGDTVIATEDDAHDAYTENNDQLNCMAVSSVEGDLNVAGVFVNWDEVDDGFNDMNIAMTGDMIIRIAQGTTVARGDLLMSAGDGTAKPQGDDIVRSKTISKVTSTHVTCTYDDGSYCVPCVLMAC